MNIQSLTGVFMWCTILNGGLLVFWTLMCLFASDLVYSTQRRWFPIPRETFNVVMYAFLGAFKMVFLAFNLIPFLALLLAG